jgi:hypothetical protein
VPLPSFVRLSAGHYWVTLDVNEDSVGNVGTTATGWGTELASGANTVDMLGTRVLFDAPGDRLTIEVTCVSIINSFGVVIIFDSDTLFTLSVFNDTTP